ncbi:MAG: MarR family transcriptional regulator [Bacteroidetes bacterium]|nr:MarR family transcriptional regulator [Bacteroidota bacterium]
MIQKNINASVIFHAIKLSETWKKNGEAITRQYGITVQQWFILLLLASDPNIIYLQDKPQEKPLLAKELAEALNVTRANITNLLNVLMRKKLIVQVTDAEDRRRKRLTLSPAGSRLVQRIEGVRNEFNDRLLSRFSKTEKEGFIIFVKACLQSMTK